MSNSMKRLSAQILCGSMFLCTQVGAQELGTLFTSPEEREYLDYLREEFLARTAEAGFDIDQNAVPDIPQEEETAQVTVQFHLSGIVSTRDSGRVVWLNGESILESDLPSNAKIVTADGVNALRLVTPERAYVIKPGQSVNVSSGEFWDAFEQGPQISDTGTLDESTTESEPQTDAVLTSDAADASSTLQLLQSLEFFQGDG
jgi:hypothetical protein